MRSLPACAVTLAWDTLCTRSLHGSWLLQVQQAELQAQQMQLHRDYMAMQLGGGPAAGPMALAAMPAHQPYSAAAPLGSGQVKPDPAGGLKPSYVDAGAPLGAALRAGSAYGDLTASGASGLSRDSAYSGQFTYAPSQQESGQPSAEGAPSCGGAAAASPRMLAQPGQPQMGCQGAGAALAPPQQAQQMSGERDGTCPGTAVFRRRINGATGC